LVFVRRIKKTSRSIAFVCATLLAIITEASALEITAINFYGELIGKVIPDGKVVGFDNSLIGNVTADSLILNSDGKIIGGVVPQGIAIGNDARPLGKVGNDGSVRMSSGQVVGRTLPNGLVVNDYFEIVGGVVFPGLVYSDKGETIGRISGEGLYTNLQGQTIGVVTPDGYAYRKVGGDYILDGRLTSSKMVVSLQGEFIGSVAPGGAISGFDGETLGQIRANGYAYDSQGKIIGRIVRTGYAFDNNGYYLGYVSYNGEVVNGEKLIGRIRADGKIVDPENKLLGYSIDPSATATDLNGRYLGRIMPEGGIAKAKEIIYQVGARGVISGTDGLPVGQIFKTGPVFDYKGDIKGHAIANGSVISLGGTNIGYMIGLDAVDLSGHVIGAVMPNAMVVYDADNSFVGVAGVAGTVETSSDILKATPQGYVYKQDGTISGTATPVASLYNSKGNFIGILGLDGEPKNLMGSSIGKTISGNIVLGMQNQLLGAEIPSLYATNSNGEFLGNINAGNLVMNTSLDVIGKILPDGGVVATDTEDSSNYSPLIGHSYQSKIVVDFGGNFIGYANLLGAVRNLSGAQIGKVVDRGFVVDNNNFVIGRVVDNGIMLNNECEAVGVLSTKGVLQNSRGTYLGRILTNGYAISDGGSPLGYLVSSSPIIDFSGRISGYTNSDGRVVNADNAQLGCLNRNQRLTNADGGIIGKSVTYSSAIGFDGKIIGQSILDGSIVDDEGSIVAYQQPNGNVNSNAGIPIGNILKYTVAFDFNNRFVGLVKEDGSVISNQGTKIGNIDFEGYVIIDNKKAGYALYDFYVYNSNGDIIGYITRSGDVVDFTNQNLGRINKGFLVDKSDQVIARGARDYLIRDNSKLVLGELNFSGDVIDAAGLKIGSLGKAGNITNNKEEIIAQANPLQYYSPVIGSQKKKMLFDKDGKFVGYSDEDGNILDKDNKVIGRVEDSSGASIENRKVFDKQGNIIGTADAEGNVLDANGKIIGKINEAGDAIDASGNIIGGINRNWYEKAPLPSTPVSKTEDVSPALKLLESSQYRKSLGIALTPDGEYLGDIMEDKTVVSKSGKVLGRLMPDGLVIDDDGTLIGIEEAKSPKTTQDGGIFVPPGTFGDGGAYGTGEGSPGNLGPGGGFGPGERYDPARQAALNTAMAQRRKNATVGKISNSTRKEAFDGMQKDWSEQGIGKIISSWRVDLSEMILADKPIPAVISRAIDSNNPSPITAYVERNVYAEEGRNVIIPAGSRLIGTLGGLTASTEATSEAARVQISWERLIRPDGSLFVFQGSLTADAQGRGGALGYVDQQLFKKYTLPVLTTSLTSATSYFMSPDSNESSTGESPRQQAANDARQSFINEMSDIFDEILRDKSNIKPMTYVPAGTRIIVFPNTDLWLRTIERDQDSSINLEKPEIFIDDGQMAAKREKNRQEKVTHSVSVDSGDVVYDAEAEDIESAKAPAPLVSNTKKNKAKGQAYIAPPPPPSNSISGSNNNNNSSGNNDSKSSGNNSVPALF